MSKYVEAVTAIGKPCSPKQIRIEVNSHEDEDNQVTTQNTASALNNLLSRDQLLRGDDGLYLTPKMQKENKPEPI